MVGAYDLRKKDKDFPIVSRTIFAVENEDKNPLSQRECCGCVTVFQGPNG